MADNSNTEEYIPIERAKVNIIAALHQYHPALGAKAADILFNEDRMNINLDPKVRDSGRVMMQCRVSGLTKDSLEAKNMLMKQEDFEAEFGPFFKDQDNPRGPAIVDFEYFGQQKCELYLAHELGHAIADDIQIQKDVDRSQMSWDDAEKQAYFVQKIYSHFTGRESSESLDLKDVDHAGDTATELRTSWARVAQYRDANDAVQDGLEIDDLDERYQHLIKALCGELDVPAATNVASCALSQQNPKLTT